MAKILTLDGTKKLLGITTALAVRYQTKIINSTVMIRELEKCAHNLESPTPDLRTTSVFCRRVQNIVDDVQTKQIIASVTRTLNGWLVSREKTPGRYAEAFLRTDVTSKVAAWLENKPLSNAHYLDFKVWRQAGYDLLHGPLEAPWGYFECREHGNVAVKVLPIQPKTGKSFIPKDCHVCYKAGKTVEAIGEAKPVAKRHVKKPGSAKARHKGGAKKAKGELSPKDKAKNAKLLTEAFEKKATRRKGGKK